MRIQELMSSPVVSLLADQTLPLARDVMRFRHIRHLPVVDTRGRVVGLISHRDLLRYADTNAELRRELGNDLRVDQVMKRHVWTVREDASAADVGRVMLQRQLGCAPVVDGDGMLLGIVTDSDFLQIALAVLDANAARAEGLDAKPALEHRRGRTSCWHVGCSTGSHAKGDATRR